VDYGKLEARAIADGLRTLGKRRFTQSLLTGRRPMDDMGLSRFGGAPFMKPETLEDFLDDTIGEKYGLFDEPDEDDND
jgi:hypothetical protein